MNFKAYKNDSLASKRDVQFIYIFLQKNYGKNSHNTRYNHT